MEIWSHPNKPLKKHIEAVRTYALKHFHKYALTNYPIEYLVKLITEFHDFGKYTCFFQQYIRGEKVDDDLKKSHSRLGAYLVLNKIYKEQADYDKVDLLASLAMLTILWHHQNLQYPLFSDLYKKQLPENLIETFNVQKEDLEKLSQQISGIKQYLSLLDLQTGRKKAIKFWHKFKKQIPDTPEYYFLFNYLFSLLIEADKLDASETPTYDPVPIPSDVVDNFLKDKPLNEINKLRTAARREVARQIDKIDITTDKIFTLTAPTGIGKTLTALDFALKLRMKLRQEKHYEPQIIYVLPFINIIEQNLGVYEEVFKDYNIKILAHYQFADVIGQEANDSDEFDLKKYDQNLMQLDTWQADIVITTFVQFFKTLITGRNKLLKKFNHYAGSIIILDEIQSLGLEKIPLAGAMLYYLTKYLDAYVIVMTATQPKLFEAAAAKLNISIKAPIKELLTKGDKYFSAFKRTQIKPLLDRPIENADEFAELFQQYWRPDKSALVVCNTVNRSIEVYNELKQVLSQDTEIFYLSTNIVPLHRKERIKQIKEKLDAGQKVVLVSTQVVEAGVDLDFDMAFRDIGPIDSIVQVAGRVNRNSRKGEFLPIYIFEFKGDASIIYGDVTVSQAKRALSSFSFIDETNYKQLVEKYFEELTDRKSYDDIRKIFDAIKALKYDELENFQVIDEKGDISVFIPVDQKAKEIIAAYQRLLNKEITKQEFDAKYKRAFHERIITVPKYLEIISQLPALTDNLKFLPFDLIDSYYNGETGFIRKDTTKVVLL